MAVAHDQIPRDENGIAHGAYRIVHRDPGFHGEIGVYSLREGVSTSPACGRALLCAIGEYGSELYLEPWGDLPPGFVLPELVQGEVPATAILERCPWRGAPAVAPVVAEALKAAEDELDDMEIDDLADAKGTAIASITFAGPREAREKVKAAASAAKALRKCASGSGAIPGGATTGRATVFCVK